MDFMDVDTMAAALAACGMAMAAAQLAVQARATRKAWLRRLAKAKAALEEAEQAETIEEDMDTAEIAAPVAEDSVDLKEQAQEQEHVQEKEEVEATEAVRDDEETSTADNTSKEATTSSTPVPLAEDDTNLHLPEETPPGSEPLATAVSKALENESQEEEVDENNEQEAETRVEAENPHTPEQQAPRRGRRSTRSSTATSGVSSKKRSTMTARKTRSTRSSDTADKENETDPRQQLLPEENKDEKEKPYEDSLGDLVMMDKVKRTAQRSSKKMSFDADTVSEASMSSRRSARARRAPKIFEPEW